MNGYESIGVDVLVLLGGAVLLAAVLLGFRALVEIAPLSKARREGLRQAVPVVAAGSAVLFCVVVVRTMLAAEPGFAALGTALVLLGFGALAFGPMRDVVSGVFLKAGRVCNVGDQVRIDDLQGRIMFMGLRVLGLETSEGEEAIIPYSRVARDRVVRTAAVDAVSPHVFRVRAPAAMTLTETKALIRRHAMWVHWSVVSRLPEVAVTDDGIEVTVYAIDADRGPDIEAAVRRALADIDPPANPAAKLESQGPSHRLDSGTRAR